MQGSSPEAALELHAPDRTASAAEIDESQTKNPGSGVHMMGSRDTFCLVTLLMATRPASPLAPDIGR